MSDQEENTGTKISYSNDLFNIMLWEEYPADKERRELRLTFSKSFYESDLYKQNGSPKTPEMMRAPEIQELAEKCGIMLFLHNPTGPAIERQTWIDNKLIQEKHYKSMWVEGKMIAFDEFEEIGEENGRKKYKFKNNPEGMSEQALRILHGHKVKVSFDKVLAE
jgi:hypothetical protein